MKNHMVTIILVLVLAVLQWLIWAPDGSQTKLTAQNKIKQAHQERNQTLAESNAIIQKDIDSFRANPDAIEAKARQDLGMIRKDETFLFIPAEDDNADER